MTNEISRIEWYSGHTLYDQPRRLLRQDQWLDILSVLQRGYTPNGAFIKILASDHAIYLLEYSLRRDSWRVVRRSEP